VDIAENKQVNQDLERDQQVGMNCRKATNTGHKSKRECYSKRRAAGSAAAKRLVSALREQRHQHHQIRQREEPLIGLRTGSFRGAGDEAQVAALGEIVDVIDANPREACDL
jgi:hypothetical protein